MKTLYTTGIIIVSICLAFFLSGCDRMEEPITISGNVIDLDSGEPVSQAEVTITSPEELSASTFSDESGTYLFDEVQVDSVIDVSIRAVREGFTSDDVTVVAVPERNLTVPNLRLRSQQQTDTPIGSQPKGAAAIILVNVQNESLNIAESGGVVNSAFTFEVQDSSGQAITDANAAEVHFMITEGPDAGETITPEVAVTNANGRVTSNIFAGSEPGNVKVEARIDRPDVGLTIRSKPILLSIHGGFPNLNHFSIAANTFNFEGWAINGNRNQITVIVGDRFSNPVKPGTPVYFNTTGGIIQGSGVTDDDGEIEVDLISGDPRPTNGYATITANTVGEDDQKISREIQVLFSGPPSRDNIQVSPSTFDIGPNGSQIFNMTLTDINGNPLPRGTSVEVIPPDGMEVDGDVNFSIPNALNAGPDVTQFTFTARDSDDESNESQDVTIRIEVETPGGFSASRTIQGRKAKTF